MKCLVLILLTFSLAATAQQQLPPCGYGLYPCINVSGGGPAIFYHPEIDPAVHPEVSAPAENPNSETYLDQQEWLFARRWAELHGCGGSKGFRGLRWYERFNLGSQPTLRQKVAYICRWR
jgi:hypothetical protein